MRIGLLTYVAVLALGHLDSTSATPSPSPALVDRHDHHAHEHHHDELPAFASTSTSSLGAASSTTSRPIPPNPHAHHGGHHQAQLELNETDVHYWHHFPPSYLAADFRLTKDQVIFGEELDETWVPEEAGGHRTLAIAHAGTFVLAYFGLLPIGKPFHCTRKSRENKCPVGGGTTSTLSVGRRGSGFDRNLMWRRQWQMVQVPSILLSQDHHHPLELEVVALVKCPLIMHSTGTPISESPGSSSGKFGFPRSRYSLVVVHSRL